jgi:hypothetical protein
MCGWQRSDAADRGSRWRRWRLSSWLPGQSSGTATALRRPNRLPSSRHTGFVARTRHCSIQTWKSVRSVGVTGSRPRPSCRITSRPRFLIRDRASVAVYVCGTPAGMRMVCRLTRWAITARERNSASEGRVEESVGSRNLELQSLWSSVADRARERVPRRVAPRGDRRRYLIDSQSVRNRGRRRAFASSSVSLMVVS